MSHIPAISEALTFLVSVVSSSFLSGVRWGRVNMELRDVANRLARIEGMFELRLREEK